jgi:DNA polymerase-3 subunit epsilon
MWLEPLLPLDSRRKRLARHCRGNALADFLATPFPDPHRDYRETEYVALDFETTGLDLDSDHILSVGTVSVHGDRIDLATASHRLVRTSRALPGETVTIHRLTDDMVAGGEAISDVINALLAQLAGKVMIAHHARVECGFIHAACRRLFGADWLMPVVDTQQLALRRLQRRGIAHRPGEMRLDKCRAAYKLPRHTAHNALTDALATAELFLAETATIGAGGPVKLKKLLSRC